MRVPRSRAGCHARSSKVDQKEANHKGELAERHETGARLRDLTKKAEKGDKKAVPAIRETLDRSPDLACRLMDLSKLAESLFSNYYQKRIDQAHGRYLSAIKTLAQIRKLGPAVQINIVEKQINTGG